MTTTLKSAWSAVRSRFSARHRQIDLVHDLYTAIVEQARQPFFYRELGVPDTLDGRFDLIVLHLSAVTDRLGEQDQFSQETKQALVGLFFADMDRSLREMGVGDLSVGKKMRNMAEALMGRSQAYAEALAASENDPLMQTIERNIYGGKEMPDAHLSTLAAYTRALNDRLKGWDGSEKGLKSVISSAWSEIG